MKQLFIGLALVFGLQLTSFSQFLGENYSLYKGKILKFDNNIIAHETGIKRCFYKNNRK